MIIKSRVIIYSEIKTMNKLAKFLRVTIAGGILFLIPLTVVLILLAKIVQYLRGVVKPIAEQLPLTHVAGLGVVTLLSIVLLLMICFIAGLFMQTSLAKRLKKWLEENVLFFIPGYSYLTAVFSDTLDRKSSENWKPATILVDDNEVFCFVVDETENYCSIFLPDSPMPSSGSICVREKDQVKFLPINVSQANILIRKFGKGAAHVMENYRQQHLKP